MNYFLFITILIFRYARTAANENATGPHVLQLDGPSASLVGAYRPAEVEMRYNKAAGDDYCSWSLAKFVVSIRKIENQQSFGHRHFCGGVIVRSNLIITAAHCVLSNRKVVRPSSIRVVVGTPTRLQRTADTEIMKVKKIIVYEALSGSSFVDLALLKLKKSIQFTKSCAAPLPLPERKVRESSMCAVLGWGKLYLNGPLANEILQINVTLHSKEFCEIFVLDADKAKICASDLMDIEKNACSGDSGGPLICEGILTGIVSYGFQCGLGFPTVYTDIYEYSNWIKENSADSLISFSALPALIIFLFIISYHLFDKF